MQARRAACLLVVVAVALLIAAVPVGAVAGAKGAGDRETGPTGAGSAAGGSAVVTPAPTMQAAEKVTVGRATVTVPIPSPPIPSPGQPPATIPVAVTITLPPPANDPPQSGGDSGAGPNPTGATTRPTVAPSVPVSPPAGGPGPAINGTTGGRRPVPAVPTMVPTTVATGVETAPTGTERDDGTGEGTPGGDGPTPSPTAGAKVGSTVTTTPSVAPATESTTPGSNPVGQPTPKGPSVIGAPGPMPGAPGVPEAPTVGIPMTAPEGASSPATANERDEGPASSPRTVGDIPISASPSGAAPVPEPFPGPTTAGPTLTGPNTTGPAITCRPVEANRTGVPTTQVAFAGVPASDPRLPTVSPSPHGFHAYQVETEGARPVGTREGGPGGTPRPQPPNSGREREPPEPPAAVPVRTGLETASPVPGDDRRGRRGTPTPIVFMEADGTVPDPLLLLRLLLFLGYRRARPGTLLDHPVRRDLVSAIAADPGLDLADCAAATGANHETLRYHLAILVCGGKVLEETRNGSVRYFPNDPTLNPIRRAVLHLRRSPSLAPAFQHIRDTPGISRRDLTALLGVAGPSVTRQVQRLAREGLVESRGCGLSQGYWLTPECEEAFAAIAAAESGPDHVMPAPEPASV